MDTSDIDIAKLVTELETISALKSVGIKPFGTNNDFILKAAFDE